MGILKGFQLNTVMDRVHVLYLDLDLNDFEVYDTLVELAEEEIRDFVKSRYKIEFGKMYAKNWDILALDPVSFRGDSVRIDTIPIRFKIDTKFTCGGRGVDDESKLESLLSESGWASNSTWASDTGWVYKITFGQTCTRGI